MRLGRGTVEKIRSNGLAKIRVNRDHLYVACSACFGAERVFITAYNPVGAQEGQDVQYEVQDNHLILSAFICFILPLLLIALGAALGYQAGMTIYTAAAGGILGLLLGAAAVKKYDSCLGKRIDTKATITAIIQPDEEEAETAE